MLKVMGAPPEEVPAQLDIEVLEEVRKPKYIRKKIRYLSAAGDRVAAYLMVPIELQAPAPAMVCLHPTGDIGKGLPAGLGEKPNRAYAHELAERGFVTISPDYPFFGDSKSDPYQLKYKSATMKGVVDHRRAIDVLASLPEVDPRRIGAIGHSLGGHNTLFLGVFDDRVRAMVSSCGFNVFRKHAGGDISAWSSKHYMPLIRTRYHDDPARLPFDFTEVLAALAPRPVFVNAPLHDAPDFEVSGVRDCIRAARPVYARVFGASKNLVVRYPDAGHDFPDAVRDDAYQFLERHLSR